MTSIRILFALFFVSIFAACNDGTQNADTNPADSAASTETTSDSEYPEEELGWYLGSQAYTFKNFTFFEAIDKIDSCGLRYVEAFPGQTLGGGLEGKMDFNMDDAKRKQILSRLQEKGMTLYGFGVVQVNSEEDWRKLFAFAKAMGIQTITSEPDPKFMPLIAKLTEEFQINLAIHNHPEPSRYWDPNTVLTTIKDHGNRVGACADIGHWTRSNLDPVESLKVLEGRILHSHMKDLTEKGNKEAHDVHWGSGASNIKGVIEELKRQNFKGMISAEYEHNWDNSVPDVKASAEFFRSALK